MCTILTNLLVRVDEGFSEQKINFDLCLSGADRWLPLGYRNTLKFEKKKVEDFPRGNWFRASFIAFFSFFVDIQGKMETETEIIYTVFIYFILMKTLYRSRSTSPKKGNNTKFGLWMNCADTKSDETMAYPNNRKHFLQ